MEKLWKPNAKTKNTAGNAYSVISSLTHLTIQGYVRVSAVWENIVVFHPHPSSTDSDMVNYENDFKGKVPRSFVNRNLVAIVMIPSLIGLHYGWYLLQKDESLVKKEERIDLPIITAAKYLTKKVAGESDGGPSSQ